MGYIIETCIYIYINAFQVEANFGLFVSDCSFQLEHEFNQFVLFNSSFFSNCNVLITQKELSQSHCTAYWAIKSAHAGLVLDAKLTQHFFIDFWVLNIKLILKFLCSFSFSWTNLPYLWTHSSGLQCHLRVQIFNIYKINSFLFD